MTLKVLCAQCGKPTPPPVAGPDGGKVTPGQLIKWTCPECFNAEVNRLCESGGTQAEWNSFD
jgi:hypothetical protein